MARNGITREQVMAAAQTLAERGEAVTVTRVRRALGETGSYTTISNYLKEWREQGDGQPPGALERGVRGMVQGLWQALTQAGDRRDAELARLAAEVNHYEEQMSDLAAHCDRQSETLARLDREIQELRQREQELAERLERR